MGVAVGAFDRNGTMDILKTNFAGDTSTRAPTLGATLRTGHLTAAWG